MMELILKIDLRAHARPYANDSIQIAIIHVAVRR